MTHNYLGAELHAALNQLDSGMPDSARRTLAALANWVATQPVEVDASTDLTVTSGLEPEQEIGADALLAAAHLLAPALSDMSWTGVEMNLQAIGDAWLTLAGRGAGFVRDGSRPA